MRLLNLGALGKILVLRPAHAFADAQQANKIITRVLRAIATAGWRDQGIIDVAALLDRLDDAVHLRRTNGRIVRLGVELIRHVRVQLERLVGQDRHLVAVLEGQDHLRATVGHQDFADIKLIACLEQTRRAICGAGIGLAFD